MRFRAVRLVFRVDVRFSRDAQLGGGVGVLTEDGLAANHDDLVVVRDVGSRANQVLELPPLHDVSARRRSTLQMRHRSRGSTTPAKGLAWRRARPSSLSATSASQSASAGPSSRLSHCFA